jgi:protein TonB
MLAYAAKRPSVFDRRPHPNAMLFIVGAHVAAVAVVMSIKMDLPERLIDRPLIIRMIPVPKPPPPITTTTKTVLPPQPIDTHIDQPKTHIDLPPIDFPKVSQGQPTTDPTSIVAGGTNVITEIPHTVVTPERTGPKLMTPESELKPPYPASKLLNEEEAVLTLRLTINDQGRVVAVDPVGRADAAFLEAARRHLISHWRFKPASEGGHAVGSTTTITLHFELDG